jgi:hypothetical protein
MNIYTDVIGLRLSKSVIWPSAGVCVCLFAVASWKGFGTGTPLSRDEVMYRERHHNVFTCSEHTDVRHEFTVHNPSALRPMCLSLKQKSCSCIAGNLAGGELVIPPLKSAFLPLVATVRVPYDIAEQSWYAEYNTQLQQPSVIKVRLDALVVPRLAMTLVGMATDWHFRFDSDANKEFEFIVDSRQPDTELRERATLTTEGLGLTVQETARSNSIGDGIRTETIRFVGRIGDEHRGMPRSAKIIARQGTQCFTERSPSWSTRGSLVALPESIS